MTLDGGDDGEDTDIEKTSNNVAYSPVAHLYLMNQCNPERSRLVVFQNINTSILVKNANFWTPPRMAELVTLGLGQDICQLSRSLPHLWNNLFITYYA